MSVAAEKSLTEFATALTEAVVTDNTLELANGTVFPGISKIRSKLFIRPCYKELSEIILDGASRGVVRDVVVTGTPGIGKSVFGWYLLYLLRCQGRTVVYELKGDWYRFSDEGVQEGEFSDFRRAGYLRDPTAWYLSDPEWRPKETFEGTTVVLVSPKEDRVKEFLKQSILDLQLFMPVFDMDEVLECRQAVYPDVPLEDVKKAFGDVGGVARAIFRPRKLQQLKDKMEKGARGMDVEVLRRVLSFQYSTSDDKISTDETGDALLHIFPLPDAMFERFEVNFASEYARNLTASVLPQTEERAVAALVGTALGNKALAAKIGNSPLGLAFEAHAHNAIGGTENGEGSDGRTFDVTILQVSSSGDGEVLGGKDSLNFDFAQREVFDGLAFPDKVDKGIYYTPKTDRFAAIDSFGVDTDADTLYFFQMKSKGVVRVNGTTVEKYWNAALASVAVSSCVFVYVVPTPKAVEGQKSTKICKGPWLEGASTGFQAKCSVCLIEIGFSY